VLRHICLTPRTRAAFLGFLVALCTPLMAAADGEALREYVDEVTAVSITVSLDSLVFARERTDLAVNARDYITLAPLQINRTGRRAYFWTGYVWSTIDRRGNEAVVAADEQLVLIADGRPIALRQASASLRDQGVGQPPTPIPVRTARPVLFEAQPDQLAYVAHARELRVAVVRDAGSESFALWRDSRRGLLDFIERLQLER
jgi:hypothetical protein